MTRLAISVGLLLFLLPPTALGALSKQDTRLLELGVDGSGQTCREKCSEWVPVEETLWPEGDCLVIPPTRRNRVHLPKNIQPGYGVCVEMSGRVPRSQLPITIEVNSGTAIIYLRDGADVSIAVYGPGGPRGNTQGYAQKAIIFTLGESSAQIRANNVRGTKCNDLAVPFVGTKPKMTTAGEGHENWLPKTCNSQYTPPLYGGQLKLGHEDLEL